MHCAPDRQRLCSQGRGRARALERRGAGGPDQRRVPARAQQLAPHPEGAQASYFGSGACRPSRTCLLPATRRPRSATCWPPTCVALWDTCPSKPAMPAQLHPQRCMLCVSTHPNTHCSVHCVQDFKDVFHRSRTNVDLKDKWRNLCKVATGERSARSTQAMLSQVLAAVAHADPAARMQHACVCVWHPHGNREVQPGLRL